MNLSKLAKRVAKNEDVYEDIIKFLMDFNDLSENDADQWIEHFGNPLHSIRMSDTLCDMHLGDHDFGIVAMKGEYECMRHYRGTIYEAKAKTEAAARFACMLKVMKHHGSRDLKSKDEKSEHVQVAAQ